MENATYIRHADHYGYKENNVSSYIHIYDELQVNFTM